MRRSPRKLTDFSLRLAIRSTKFASEFRTCALLDLDLDFSGRVTLLELSALVLEDETEAEE